MSNFDALFIFLYLLFKHMILDSIRIGLIGVGQRGMKTLERYAFIRHAQICAVADLYEERLTMANYQLRAQGRKVAKKFSGKEAWKKLCEAKDIDLIYICTDWSSHTQMAVYAMQQGKDVAVEVPAATTVEECWQLVDTSEQTGRHCFMTENCCYDRFALATLEMQREGRFGDLTHCEGAYIHTLNIMEHDWMEKTYKQHGGNPYPTHGLGPIGWLLNLHRGDRLDYLVSMTSQPGQINTTLLKTVKGKSIFLQLDVCTPRPYNRLQTICGTKGFSQKYPVPTLQFDKRNVFIGDEALEEAKKYETSDASLRWNQGHKLGVPNEMNYAMDSRLIHCLRHGLPLDIDVYDAAEWSCIAELSQISAQEESRPVEIPDFTRGRWKENPPHTFF